MSVAAGALSFLLVFLLRDMIVVVVVGFTKKRRKATEQLLSLTS